jgi:hypothetical protein
MKLIKSIKKYFGSDKSDPKNPCLDEVSSNADTAETLTLQRGSIDSPSRDSHFTFDENEFELQREPSVSEYVIGNNNVGEKQFNLYPLKVTNDVKDNSFKALNVENVLRHDATQKDSESLVNLIRRISSKSIDVNTPVLGAKDDSLMRHLRSVSSKNLGCVRLNSDAERIKSFKRNESNHSIRSLDCSSNSIRLCSSNSISVSNGGPNSITDLYDVKYAFPDKSSLNDSQPHRPGSVNTRTSFLEINALFEEEVKKHCKEHIFRCSSNSASSKDINANDSGSEAVMVTLDYNNHIHLSGKKLGDSSSSVAIPSDLHCTDPYAPWNPATNVNFETFHEFSSQRTLGGSRILSAPLNNRKSIHKDIMKSFESITIT